MLATVDKEPPAQDGNDPHEGAGPSQRNHDQGSLLGPLSEVLEGRSDGPVPVEGEDEKVENGGAGSRVVNRQPELTGHVAELPIACNKYVSRITKLYFMCDLHACEF